MADLLVQLCLIILHLNRNLMFPVSGIFRQPGERILLLQQRLHAAAGLILIVNTAADNLLISIPEMNIKRIVCGIFPDLILHLCGSHPAAVHSIDHCTFKEMVCKIKCSVSVKANQKNQHQCSGNPENQKILFSAFSSWLVLFLILFFYVFFFVVFRIFLSAAISMFRDFTYCIPYQFLNRFVYLVLNACVTFLLGVRFVKFKFFPLLLVIIIKFHFLLLLTHELHHPVRFGNSFPNFCFSAFRSEILFADRYSISYICEKNCLKFSFIQTSGNSSAS